MSFTERAAARYENLISAAGAAEKSFRQQAWARYSRSGLPDRRDERWKYTNLHSATAERELSQAGDSLPPAVAGRIETWARDFSVVVTVDGRFRPELSRAGDLKLAALDFADLKLTFDDGWSGLVSAIARPGYSLHVADQSLKPVLIVHAQGTPNGWTPTVNRIVLNDSARLDLAEIHLGVDGTYARAELTDVEVGEDAVLNWVRVQDEGLGPAHFSEVQSRLRAGAQLYLTQLHGGADWCRSVLRAEILGERAGAHLSGLTFARGRQHIDQRVEVRHARGLSESAQLFKSVLKDHARGVLNGKILIERDAQKVSSMQLNHNLLLSRTAEADTKPELEIYADDVKANHGASIGRLDEDKVFYLMSRGLPRPLAQQMLAHAFVGDVLMKIPTPLLRRFADACVQRWLPDFSADMEHLI